jgi:hypothetical protein
MKRIYFNLGALSALALILAACSKKPDPVSELERTAATMAKTEPAPAAAEASSAPAPAGPAPAAQLQEAIADYKAGKMEDAVTRLQLLRAAQTLSPQQRMALQDSVAAVMSELYSLAEKGDQRAIAAVAKYEAMQTHR